MPVTSLPIYGLRNRAGPGGFCRHMADLHTGSASRARNYRFAAGGNLQGSVARDLSCSPGPKSRDQQGGGVPPTPLQPL
jgi:hypothetical protein